MFDRIFKHRLLTLTLLVAILGLSVVISANSGNALCRFILNYFDSWAQVYRTIGTLLVAYLAYIAIIEERRIREEDKELDHERRSLDGIIEWARSVQHLCLMRGSLRNIEEVEATIVSGEWAVMTAGTFGKDFMDLIDKTRKDLVACVAAPPDSEDIIPPDALYKSVNAVLEASFRLKIQYKL